jgi:alpha-N-arabinofuranosidase
MKTSRVHLLALFLMLAVNVSAQKTFKNPILPGFHPDPSLCRVGDDYYMVTSSFEWFPGLPVFHSKDLVNWEQIGHVLNRPSQLQMKDGLKASWGLWAPTIRYHNGLYYVICTATGCGGNFFVTAKKPEGPYSEPIFIKDAPGIDPSLFFDDDGKAWYCGSINGNDKTPPRRYPAEDRIYIQQLDLATGEFIGERHIVSSGYAINSPYAEAPHIYKINGKYYLMIAEGGTWEDHAVSIFTADQVTGPYTPFICNPVLTHRHLGNDIDITTIGHADWVQTQNGDWYAVMLGVRPVNGYNMLGRETFLTPISFQGEQPIFNPGIGRVLMEDKFPNLPESPVALLPVRDDFDTDSLRFCWNFLRTPFERWYELKNSRLYINLRPQKATELVNPSLIARRVEDHRFKAITSMNFKPSSVNEEAGMIIMQNDRFQYRLVLVGKGKTPQELRLILVKDGNEEILARVPYKINEVVLAVQGDGLKYSFLYGTSEDQLEFLGKDVDATVCSTNVAKGFIGPFVGMYASSNGKVSKNKAAFDWFSYSKY